MYWVGPMAGAALATFVYKVIFDLPDRPGRVNKADKTERKKKKKIIAEEIGEEDEKSGIIDSIGKL